MLQWGLNRLQHDCRRKQVNPFVFLPHQTRGKFISIAVLCAHLRDPTRGECLEDLFDLLWSVLASLLYNLIVLLPPSVR